MKIENKTIAYFPITEFPRKENKQKRKILTIPQKTKADGIINISLFFCEYIISQ